MAVALSLVDIHKSFDDAHVLRGISFDVKEGTTHALVGPSGGGKSTLFRILLGYYAPDKGQILYNGMDVSRNVFALRRAVGYTTQDDSFYKTLTAFENLQYYSRLYGVAQKKADLLVLLKQVELDGVANELVRNFSGGMRRRLNFAISLVHSPDILLLDEPTTGLDPRLVEQFWRIVEKFKKQGKTIIVTTHIFEEVERFADRVSIMHKGRIAKSMRPKNVLGEFKKICYPTS